MGRKSLAGLILLIALVASAGMAMAAEKVDNVFITGFDGGYFGYTGWMAENYAPGYGGSVFFGYGITPNFSIQLDYTPLITSEPNDDCDVEFLYTNSYWGGIGQEYSGMGGIGLSGKLYPRDRFRDADFVIVQPYYRMGLGWMPFIWEYQDYTKSPPLAEPLFNNEDFDGFNTLYLNLGGGVDFMLAKWVSLGLDLRIWTFSVIGDTINGYDSDYEGNSALGTPGFYKSEFQSSYMYQAGLNVTFQW